MDHHQLLTNNLSLAVRFKDTKPRQSSIAISANNHIYPGANVDSQNHILTIPSELSALLVATSNNDASIKKVYTFSEDPETSVYLLPLVLKILIDHYRRTGEIIAYELYDQSRTLFSTLDVSTVFPFYTPTAKPIFSYPAAHVSPNEYLPSSPKSVEENLFEAAKLGLHRAFTTSSHATAYGAAVLTKTNRIFFSGQYSSFDHRANVHAEMSAIINAFMAGEKEIVAIGVLSNKHLQMPCDMCGICRQFAIEMANLINENPQIYTFALENRDCKKYSLASYLPSYWKNYEKI